MSVYVASTLLVSAMVLCLGIGYCAGWLHTRTHAHRAAEARRRSVADEPTTVLYRPPTTTTYIPRPASPMEDDPKLRLALWTALTERTGDYQRL